MDQVGAPASARLLRMLLALVVAAAFVLYVWPTAWRYDRMTIAEDTYPVRIHRITGEAQILIPGDGWTPAEDASDGSPDGTGEEPGNRT